MKSIPSTSDARIQNNSMRHQYRVLTDDAKALVDRIKGLGADLEQAIAQTPSRESWIATTNLQTAVMWAVRGTRHDQARPRPHPRRSAVDLGRALGRRPHRRRDRRRPDPERSQHIRRLWLRVQSDLHRRAGAGGASLGAEGGGRRERSGMSFSGVGLGMVQRLGRRRRGRAAARLAHPCPKALRKRQAAYEKDLRRFIAEMAHLSDDVFRMSHALDSGFIDVWKGRGLGYRRRNRLLCLWNSEPARRANRTSHEVIAERLLSKS